MSPDEYSRLDARGLASLIQCRDVSLEDVYAAARTRAAQMAPRYHPFAWYDFDSALKSARDVPGEAPFAGIPTFLKDLNTFKAGWPATQGSAALREQKASINSTLVDRFERSGLIPAGQTTTPEFGLSYTCESTLWGTTTNPFVPGGSSGGSSGGSAAAVASGIVPIAHATDSAGSIRVPASLCGLFGLKPSRGRIPIGPDAGERMAGLTTAHVLSRTVRDSALALDGLHGYSTGDPYGCSVATESYLAACDHPRRWRIGVVTSGWTGIPVDPHCRAALDHTAKILAACGSEVQEIDPQICYEELFEPLLRVIASQIATSFQRLQADVELAQPIVAEAYTMGRTITATQYVSDIHKLQTATRLIGALFDHVDLWLAPTTFQSFISPGTFGLNDGDYNSFIRRFLQFAPACILGSVAGLPAASVPVYWTEDGTPVGTHIMAKLGFEHEILSAAALLEGEAPWLKHYERIRACGAM